MEDKFTLFAALVCAVAILVVTWWEHHPSFFWWRYLFGLEKNSPDMMEWNEVVHRVANRARKAHSKGRVALSNGVYADFNYEEWPGGNVKQFLTLYLKRQNTEQFPIAVQIDVLTGDADVTGVDASGDSYQWMMEQIGAEMCYEIAKRAYICEQKGHRGDTERAKVEQEYISWITRKFI